MADFTAVWLSVWLFIACIGVVVLAVGLVRFAVDLALRSDWRAGENGDS